MSTTAGSYLVTWLDSALASKSPRTREGYARDVRQAFTFLEQQGLPTDVASLRPGHFRAFFSALRARGANQNTVAHYDRTLRAIFARIDREGREDFDLPPSWRSPLQAVEKSRPVPVCKQPLSAQQVQRLVHSMPRVGFIAYRDYAQLAFMLMAGARSIEVCNLRVSELSLEQGLATLHVTKGSKPRVVYLPSRLVRILSNYLRRRERVVGSDLELVFCTRTGGQQGRRALHRAVQRAGRRIGLPDLGPHRLRHSYVTLSHAKGAPLKFLQEQCGHSSILVTQAYIHLSHEQKAELAERFSAI